MDVVIGIFLLVAALFLIISVLLQNSKSHKLSGTIAGGAETFFGKSRGTTIDRVLSKVTTIVAIVFCVLVVAMYVLQDQAEMNIGGDTSVTADTGSMIVGDTTEAGGDTSADDTTEDGETTLASESEDGADSVDSESTAVTEAAAE